MPIPQPQPSVLAQNPQFARLWHNLIDSDKPKIRSDGTTNKPTKSPRIFGEEDAKRLRELRLKGRRREILLRGLRNAAATSIEQGQGGFEELMDEDVTETVVTMSVLVEQVTSKGLSAKEFECLEYGGIFEEFEEKLDVIARAVGMEIQRERRYLADLLTQSPTSSSTAQTSQHQQRQLPPSTSFSTKSSQPPPSFSTKPTRTRPSPAQPQPLPPSLPLSIPTIPIPSPSPSLTTTTTTALSTHLHTTSTLLTTLITHLELHLHGHQTRHLKSRLTHLTTVSEGMRLKSAVLVGRGKDALYSSGTREALHRYALHLDVVGGTVEERREAVKEALGEYYGSDEDDDGMKMKMKEMAGRYGALLGEEEKIRAEIRRIEDSGRGNKERVVVGRLGLGLG